MYLHLGQDTVITTETVIGIFDMDECTVSKKTRDYLTAAEKRGRVVNVSFELPKSFVVCEKNGKNYRLYQPAFIKNTHKKKSISL